MVVDRTHGALQDGELERREPVHGFSAIVGIYQFRSGGEPVNQLDGLPLRQRHRHRVRGGIHGDPLVVQDIDDVVLHDRDGRLA